MGKIILTCGHQDLYHPSGWAVREKTVESRTGSTSILYSQYCSECFSYLLTKWPETLISSDYEEEEWLKGNG